MEKATAVLREAWATLPESNVPFHIPFSVAEIVIYMQGLLKTAPRKQTWLTGKNAVPVRLNPIGQHDENN